MSKGSVEQQIVQPTGNDRGKHFGRLLQPRAARQCLPNHVLSTWVCAAQSCSSPLVAWDKPGFPACFAPGWLSQVSFCFHITSWVLSVLANHPPCISPSDPHGKGWITFWAVLDHQVVLMPQKMFLGGLDLSLGGETWGTELTAGPRGFCDWNLPVKMEKRWKTAPKLGSSAAFADLINEKPEFSAWLWKRRMSFTLLEIQDFHWHRRPKGSIHLAEC